MASAPEKAERPRTCVLETLETVPDALSPDGFSGHICPALAEALVDRADLHVVHLGRDWSILGANAAARLALLRGEDLDGRCFLDFVDEGSASVLQRMVAAGKLDRGAATVLHPVAAGARTVEYSFRSVEDGWIGVGRDRSEEFELVSQMAALVEDLESAFGKERALACQLKELAERDALTGLFNRRQLEECLHARIRSFVEAHEPFAVVCVDVDHFKRVNDRYGHSVGDEALRCVAQAIQGVVRDGDTAARYGGEEFVVVLASASDEQAASVAERLRVAVEGAPLPTPIECLTVSVGVAWTSPCDAGRATRLFDLADAALYRAKAEGRNRVCCSQ